MMTKSQLLENMRSDLKIFILFRKISKANVLILFYTNHSIVKVSTTTWMMELIKVSKFPELAGIE